MSKIIKKCTTTVERTRSICPICNYVGNGVFRRDKRLKDKKKNPAKENLLVKDVYVCKQCNLLYHDDGDKQTILVMELEFE